MHRLLQVDELLRAQHYYLSPLDDCYYFMEYTARAGFRHSPSNDLILNFKKPMDMRDSPQWKHKAIAIRKIVEMFDQGLRDLPAFDRCLYVPVPPSKRKDHEHYDDRIVQVLSRYCARRADVEMRELLSTRENKEPAHELAVRPKVEEIAANLELELGLCGDAAAGEAVGKNAAVAARRIVLVDDVMTSGAHFVACKRLLGERFPEADIIGLFVARRAL